MVPPAVADQIRGSLLGALQMSSAVAVNDVLSPTPTWAVPGAMVSWVTQGDRVVITVNDGVSTQTLDIPVPVIN